MNRFRATVLLALLGACSSPSKAPRAPDVFWPNGPSLATHERAHERWSRHMVERREDPAAVFDDVQDELAQARASDGRIALYAALQGRVHMDSADAAALRQDAAAYEEHVKAARQAYRDAIGLCSDWVPAHVGLAQIARYDQRWGQAEEHLREAIQATGRALGRVEKDPSLAEMLFGTPKPRAADPLGSIPTEEERRKLLLEQLATSERWSFNPPPGAQLGVGGPGLSGDRLLRRLRDRIALERANLGLARALEDGDAPRRAYGEFVDAIDRDILQSRGDLTEAYLARAHGLLELGEVSAALPDLEYLLQNPYLQQNGDLAQLLAETRAEHDLDRAEKAVEAWTRTPEEADLLRAVELLNGIFEGGAAQSDVLARATLLYADLMAAYARRSPAEGAQAHEFALQRIELTLRDLPPDHPQRPALNEARTRLETPR